ncbi:MAG TPA: hypothetical protein VH988_02190 [Thermoanaerobaculia bacterium]|nr:hypothetical protein [Thermoanaerobaculia bacterium]
MIPRTPRAAGVSMVTEVAIASSLAILAWLLYAPAARLWWTHDDLYHVHLILGNPRAWYFWDRAVYQAPPPKMLTPLLFLSLDADRFLFGLRPMAFHIHQIASLSLAAPALYGVLRLWLERAWAALGAAVFLLGPPVASIALMVMVRHYVEVIPLAALAVGLWVLAFRQPQWSQRGVWLSAASALCWFLAALEKETAVPLVFFLPLIPEGTVRERLRRAVPHAAALLAYVAIRLYFLGTPQPYGFEVKPGDWPGLALALPLKVAAVMRGMPSPASWALLIVLLCGLLFVAAQSWGNALRVGAGLAFALAPVLPVSTQMEPRYAVAAWLMAAVTLPFAWQSLSARSGRSRSLAAALAVAVCALVANRIDWADRLADSQRRSAESLAFLSMPPGELLRGPRGVPGELGELRWWKEDVMRLPHGAGWFLDDLYLCLHPETARVLGWDEATERVIDLSPRLPSIRRTYCRAIHDTAPLAVEIRGEGTGVAWSLGPYAEGRYRFVLGDGGTAVDMPRTGGFLLRQLAPFSLRVKYEAPDGWVTYSPVLSIDPAAKTAVRWRRERPAEEAR